MHLQGGPLQDKVMEYLISENAKARMMDLMLRS